MMCQKIGYPFFERNAVTVARGLLGQRLVSIVDGIRVAGLIVETEAYLGVEDKAAHTVGGRHTKRNHSMWLGGGHAYVYFTYGMHYCMNVVAGNFDDPVAVLIRAVEPVEGLKVMLERRLKAKVARDLCSGPAKMCQAFGIDRKLDGIDMVDSGEMFIERVRKRAYNGQSISVGPRVGIGYASEWTNKPLRFWISGNKFVSGR